MADKKLECEDIMTGQRILVLKAGIRVVDLEKKGEGVKSTFDNPQASTYLSTLSSQQVLAMKPG